MQLLFLGTASCYPTASRGVSCTALRIENGDVWLFDCGESSQIQLQKSNIRPGRITKVFITHLHGDHLFGLAGLMCTLGNQVQERADFILEIFGPQGIRRYVRETLGLSRSALPFDYVVHEMLPDPEQFPEDWNLWTVNHIASENHHPQERKGRDISASEGRIWNLIDEGGFKVSAGPMVHRVPTFGFVVCERNSPGRLDVVRLKELGVPPGPLYTRIKNGETITLESGLSINPDEVLGVPKIGRKLTILGDTSDASAISLLAQDSDIVIHEATLENAMNEKANLNGHSTPSIAAAFALKVNARMLIIYHYSQRYKAQQLEEDLMQPCVSWLLREAQEVLEGSTCNVLAAEDLMELTIPRQDQISSQIQS